MKPIIGINMSYSDYKNSGSIAPSFRDVYKVYISYVDVVVEYGGMALAIPPYHNLHYLDDYLELAQGFLFTGGDDYPPEFYNEKKHPRTKLCHKRRTDADIYLARKVLDTDKPVLAVCGGIQLFNIALGGKLIQDLEHLEIHNKKTKILDNKHNIEIVKDSLLFEIFKKDEILVNSAHHQAVDPAYIGDGLRVTAIAEDDVIETLELKEAENRFFLAVQWHPERIDDREHRDLIFDAFIDAARRGSS